MWRSHQVQGRNLPQVRGAPIACGRQWGAGASALCGMWFYRADEKLAPELQFSPDDCHPAVSVLAGARSDFHRMGMGQAKMPAMWQGGPESAGLICFAGGTVLRTRR